MSKLIVLALAAAFIIQAVELRVLNQTCTKKVETERFDCYPESDASEEGCVKRGCCWNPRGNLRGHYTSGQDVPFCFYPDDFPNYQVVASNRVRGGNVYSIQKMNATYRPNEILKLEVRVTYDTNYRLRVQIVDPNSERYTVPLNTSTSDRDSDLFGDDTDYQIAVSESPFSIKIYRKSTARLM